MSNKTLILYVFHEINENVEFFFKNGLFNNDNKNFIIIQNNLNYDKIFWSFLSNYNNVNLFIRENIGLDFQAYNEILFSDNSILTHKVIYSNTNKVVEEKNYLHKLFTKFVFINSTVKGPYLSDYITLDWVDYFTAPLSNDVKITGISIYSNLVYKKNFINLIEELYNITCPNLAHMQSMAFSLDREGLDILIKYNFFNSNKNFSNIRQIIITIGEIAMSSILRYEKKSLYSFIKTQGIFPYYRNDDTGFLLTKYYSPTETIFTKYSWLIQ
jgi:hypothetical protein